MGARERYKMTLEAAMRYMIRADSLTDSLMPEYLTTPINSVMESETTMSM